MKESVSLAVVCILCCYPSYSQFLPDLQAKTTAEYDAYLDVLDGPAIGKGVSFEKDFPHSTLRLPVCELMTRAYRAKGQSAEAIAAARRGLAVSPNYIPLLVELADLLANGSSDLDLAGASARQALDLLRTAKAPLRIAPEEWIAATAALRARAHSALGLVHFKRDDTAAATQAFEAALAANPPGDPAVHYRLGRLYALAGRAADARRHLERAAATGDPALAALANAALRF